MVRGMIIPALLLLAASSAAAEGELTTKQVAFLTVLDTYGSCYASASELADPELVQLVVDEYVAMSDQGGLPLWHNTPKGQTEVGRRHTEAGRIIR